MDIFVFYLRKLKQFTYFNKRRNVLIFLQCPVLATVLKAPLFFLVALIYTMEIID